MFLLNVFVFLYKDKVFLLGCCCAKLVINSWDFASGLVELQSFSWWELKSVKVCKMCFQFI